MFKDYYKILNISYPSSKDEIKKAYREMSLKWHPDRNSGKEVIEMMQDINEAYAILKDEEKKQRYDNEFVTFCSYKSQKQTKEESCQGDYTNKEYDDIYTDDFEDEYEVHDSNLKDDINEARKLAKDLVDEFLKTLKKESISAANGFWDGAKGYVYAAIVLTIIGMFVSTCSG